MFTDFFIWMEQNPALAPIVIIIIAVVAAVIFRTFFFYFDDTPWFPTDHELIEWVEFQIKPYFFLEDYYRDTPRRIYNSALQRKKHFEGYYAKRGMDYPPNIEAEFKGLITGNHTTLAAVNRQHRFGARVIAMYNTEKFARYIVKKYNVRPKPTID